MLRALPTGIWLGRAFVPGALNFSIFWSLLAVYREEQPGIKIGIVQGTSARP
tara:strand:- start:165 stop:320 length:156 start_codon:yes stop_codon:yes gene_type:complete